MIWPGRSKRLQSPISVISVMADSVLMPRKTGELLDLRTIEVAECDLFDLTIEIVTATDLVVHERQILAEHRTVL